MSRTPKRPAHLSRRSSPPIMTCTLLVVVTALTAISGPATAQDLPVVYLNGHITEDRDCAADTVYVCQSTVYIDSGVTMTAEAGTIFKFYNNYGMQVHGTFALYGTGESPVYFSSIHDDELGGDSNGNGSDTSPAPGNWFNVEYINGQNDIHHAVYRYAGYHSSWRRALYLNNCAPDVTDCIFEYNLTVNAAALYATYGQTEPVTQTIARNSFIDCSRGIYVGGNANLELTIEQNDVRMTEWWEDHGQIGIYFGGPFASCTLSENTIYHYSQAILMQECTPTVTANDIQDPASSCWPYTLIDAFPVFSNNTIAAEVYPTIRLQGSVHRDGTFGLYQGQNWPYSVVGNHLTIASDATVTVPPGAVFKFEDARVLYVDGILDLQGTDGDPVIFTGWRDDTAGGDTNLDGGASEPAPGNWYCLQYNNGQNTVHHAVFRYAGYHSGWRRAVWLNNCAPEVTDCIFEWIYSDGYGAIYATYNQNTPIQQTIARNSFTECKRGIHVSANDRLSCTIEENTFTMPEWWGDHGHRGINCVGPFNEPAGLRIESNEIFHYSQAIVVQNCTPQINGNDIQDPASACWPYTLIDAYPVFSGNTITADIYPTIRLQGAFHRDGTLGLYQGQPWPYTVAGEHLTVASDATVTLPPSSVVKFTDHRVLYIDGVLDLQGTDSEPVIFTGWRDDTAGGDTNLDGSASQPAAGNWYSLKYNNGQNTVHHAVLRYAGYNWQRPLWLDNCAPDVTDCVFEDNSSSGYGAIYATYNQDTPLLQTIARNTFTDCTRGIYLSANDRLVATIEENTITMPEWWADHGQVGINCVGPFYGNNGLTVRANEIFHYSQALAFNDCTPIVTENTIDDPGHACWPYTLTNAFPDFSDNTISEDVYSTIRVQGGFQRHGTFGPYQGENWPYTVAGDHLHVGTEGNLSLPAGTIMKFEDHRVLYVHGTLDLQGTDSEPVIFTGWRDDTAGGDTNLDGDATQPAPGDWYCLQYNNGQNTVHHAVFRYAGYNSGWRRAVWLNNCAPNVTDCVFEAIYSNGYGAIFGTYTDVVPATQIIARNTFTDCAKGIYIAHASLPYVDLIVEHNQLYGPEGAQTGVHLENAHSSQNACSYNTVDGFPTGIYLNNYTGSVNANSVANCDNGLFPSNGSELTVAWNSLEHCGTGLFSESASGGAPCTLDIQSNIFSNNDIGMHLGSSNIGQYDGPDATIHGCNFAQNSTYNLQMGAYQDPASRIIDATGNWWGSTDPALIEASIFHFPDDNARPFVNYSGYASEAFELGAPVLRVMPSHLTIKLFNETRHDTTMILANEGLEALSFTIHEAVGADALEPPPADGGRNDLLPWVTASPDLGAIPGGGQLPIAVAFESVEPDVLLTGYFVIENNDPDQALLVVPLELEVGDLFLQTPDGGERLEPEELYVIRWDAEPSLAVTSFDLMLSTDGGANYPADQIIASGLPGGDRHFDWLPTISSESCRIKVVAQLDGGGELSDTSNRDFEVLQPVGVAEDELLPAAFAVIGAAPNPFNPMTRIHFDLPRDSRVDVTIYDVRGRQVWSRRIASAPAGANSVAWRGVGHDGRELASGMYFARIATPTAEGVARLTLIR